MFKKRRMFKIKQNYKNKRNVIIPMLIVSIVLGLSIWLNKGSLLICLLVALVVLAIVISQYITGDNGMMYLVGLVSAILLIGVIVVLALLSKSYPIILKIITFPY